MSISFHGQPNAPSSKVRGEVECVSSLKCSWDVFSVESQQFKCHLALKTQKKNKKKRNAVTCVIWGKSWYAVLFMLKPLLANEHVSKPMTAPPPPPPPTHTLIISHSALPLSSSQLLHSDGGRSGGGGGEEWGDKKNEKRFWSHSPVNSPSPHWPF